MNHEFSETIIELIITCVIALGALLYIYYFKPDFFQKIKQGFSSFLTTLHFAKEHKAIWFFALLKTSIWIALLIFFAMLKKYNLISIDLFSESSRHAPHAASQPIGAIVKELLFVMITFMGAGYLTHLIDLSAISYILNLLNKQEASISNSFSNAFSRAWLVLKFFLVDYLIAIITRNKKAESSRFSIVNAILKSIMGLAWSLATYFIMPVMAEEKLTLKQSIKESAEIMKSHFGNVVGFQIGTGFLFLPAFFILLLIVLFGGIVALIQGTGRITTPIILHIILVMAIVAIIFLSIALVTSMVITWIFICAAYNFARGRKTGPFDEHFITAAIEKK